MCITVVLIIKPIAFLKLLLWSSSWLLKLPNEELMVEKIGPGTPKCG